jgi:hypothetical protein
VSFIRKHATTIIVSFITAAVTAGAPAIAAIVNADTIDGFSAVGPAASLTTARGKLVAHNNQGVIPAKFVPQVGNANSLDGMDSSAFATANHTHQPGDAATLEGLTAGEIGATEISIPLVPGPVDNTGNQMQNCGSDVGYIPLPHMGCPVSGGAAWLASWTAFVDPTNYPASATVLFEVAMNVFPNRTGCARLFDVTASQPVAGSEVCIPNPSATANLGVRLRSSAFALPAGQHEFIVQVKAGDVATGLFMWGSIVFDW